MSEREQIHIKGQAYEIMDRRIINYGPQLGQVFAELHIKKPQGGILYSADEIYHGRAMGAPVYTYQLRPDREAPNQGVQRKLQEKSPCCNRTLRYVDRGYGREPRRFCRKCDKEIL